ncbi:DUF3040 domain-containing protein [Actinoplanes flavus]|uniref:DUF3040 domain-containing protein n=1 Tax=Actinoplanes flavus TaxID=2820290 RepID=A0ABS3URZ3_9ACTN|nr:DUF3040 domain-containing protein [Actinoplanes flavus]MBO3741198.1 DUF3040 domain-containing protein [Actinoplanes flavus]
MLSDDDRRTLAELESELEADPEFAARMAAPEPEVRFPIVFVLCVALFVLVPPVMLLFGWPGLIITADVFATVIAVVLIARHRRERYR